jgi:hypothetical protein
VETRCSIDVVTFLTAQGDVTAVEDELSTAIAIACAKIAGDTVDAEATFSAEDAETRCGSALSALEEALDANATVSVEPPACEANQEQSASCKDDCQEQAQCETGCEASASANAECTPASVTIEGNADQDFSELLGDNLAELLQLEARAALLEQAIGELEAATPEMKQLVDTTEQCDEIYASALAANTEDVEAASQDL